MLNQIADFWGRENTYSLCRGIFEECHVTNVSSRTWTYSSTKNVRAPQVKDVD